MTSLLTFPKRHFPRAIRTIQELTIGPEPLPPNPFYLDDTLRHKFEDFYRKRLGDYK